VPQNSQPPFHQQHKLALQSFAFAVMMIAPPGLYFVAQRGSNVGVLSLLVALGGGMLLAAWVG
jgi:hypothetical protein